MAKYYILHETESGESITYLIVEDPDSVFVPDTQDIFNISNSNLFNGDQEITLEEANLEHEKSTQEDISLTSSDNILNEIKSFEKFLADVEYKLCLLEDAIISDKVATKEISKYIGIYNKYFER